MSSSSDCLPLLPYTSINPSAPTTLLLLHCALSSPAEYKASIPYLSSVSASYNLIIPYLPSHLPPSEPNIKSCPPLTLSNTSHLLSRLILHITADKSDKKVHLVGMSLSSHIALDLAVTHPELIYTVFVSGYRRFEPSFLSRSGILSCALSGIQWVEKNLIPKSFVTWILGGELPYPPILADRDQAGKEIFEIMVSNRVVGEIENDISVCVVAATKWPSGDTTKDAKRVIEEIAPVKQGGTARRVAVEMKKMGHPWHLLQPELFAKCVIRWVEKGEVLDEEVVVL